MDLQLAIDEFRVPTEQRLKPAAEHPRQIAELGKVAVRYSVGVVGCGSVVELAPDSP